MSAPSKWLRTEAYPSPNRPCLTSCFWLGVALARIDAVAAALPDGESVTFEINRAWQPATAMQVLNSVASRDWIEQPCETLDHCAHVAERVPQPIMLDESMHEFQDHLEAWRRRLLTPTGWQAGSVTTIWRWIRCRDRARETAAVLPCRHPLPGWVLRPTKQRSAHQSPFMNDGSGMKGTKHG